MASYTARKNKAGEVISYQIKVSRGRDKLTGKQLTPYTMTYTPPEGWSKKAIERDLQKKMGEFEAACKRGEVLTKEEAIQQAIEEKERKEAERKKPTFEQYVEYFIKEKKVSLAPCTIARYIQLFKEPKRYFKDTKLENITMPMIKEFLGYLQTEYKNPRTGEPLSHATVVSTFVVIHGMFGNAVENGVLERSPIENMKKPKARKDDIQKEAVCYTEEEIQYIFECLNKESLKWRAFIMFAIDSGCRKGEIVALKWENIDFKTGRVNICLNAQYSSYSGVYLSKPKSGYNREIYLNTPVLQLMKEWKREQAKLFFSLGVHPSGFCFTRDDGEMMSPGTPMKFMRRFGKRHNLPDIHMHALRHTMATISIANGADVVSVSKKLGHSTPAVTLNVYSHANEEAQKRANDKLAEALYNTNTKQA